MKVTYLGFVHGTLAALRDIRPRDKGTIIQIGSALAYRGIPLPSSPAFRTGSRIGSKVPPSVFVSITVSEHVAP